MKRLQVLLQNFNVRPILHPYLRPNLHPYIKVQELTPEGEEGGSDMTGSGPGAILSAGPDTSPLFSLT